LRFRSPNRCHATNPGKKRRHEAGKHGMARPDCGARNAAKKEAATIGGLVKPAAGLFI